MKIEAVPFQEIPLIFMQSIAQQTSVNLVDIFESKTSVFKRHALNIPCFKYFLKPRIPHGCL